MIYKTGPSGDLRRIATVDDRAVTRDRRVEACRGSHLDEARAGNDRVRLVGNEVIELRQAVAAEGDIELSRRSACVKDAVTWHRHG